MCVEIFGHRPGSRRAIQLHFSLYVAPAEAREALRLHLIEMLDAHGDRLSVDPIGNCSNTVLV